MVDAEATAPAHGGLVAAELAALGLADDDVLDLSVNVNPYGPCASVRRAIEGARCDRYPDPTATPARAALASREGISAERVVVGNGAVDLMWTLARALLREGDPVVVVEPAFSEMRTAASLAGATIVEHRLLPARGFALDVGALDTTLRATRPRLVYVATPANPSGVCTPLADLEALARRHPATLFVVDVSFLSLSARYAELLAAKEPSIVWLRSFTKDHALAGLRVGAAIAPVEVARLLERHRPPWSVNAPAQAALIAALDDEGARFVATSRARLMDDRAALEASLAALVLRTHASDTVYLLVDLGRRRARDLRARLLARHRILVRDATTFGLPHHLRIAVRPAEARARLVAALDQELRR